MTPCLQIYLHCVSEVLFIQVREDANIPELIINQARPFQSFARSGGLSVPDSKNQGYYPPTEMKLCVSHYSHKTMPDAKFESGSFSISGDMTSQNLPLKKGTSHRIQVFTPGKWV